jgi:tetratricopeptide (TPR) repeat protein
MFRHAHSMEPNSSELHRFHAIGKYLSNLGDIMSRTSLKSMKYGDSRSWMRRQVWFISLFVLAVSLFVCFITMFERNTMRDIDIIDEDYQNAIISNDVRELVRILREYSRNDLILPDFRDKPEFSHLTSMPNRPSKSWYDDWVHAFRLGGVRYLFETKKEIDWHHDWDEVIFWWAIAQSFDDEGYALSGYPRLMEAVIDEWEKAGVRFRYRWPLEVEDSMFEEDLEEDNDFSIFEPDAPNSISYSTRANLYEKQFRIGDAVDSMMRSLTESSDYDPLRNIVSYAVLGERDNFLSEQWDPNTVVNLFAQKDPENPYVIRALGLSYWRRGRSAAAEARLRQAATDFENDPLGRFAWASCMEDLDIPFDPVSIMEAIRADHPHFRTQEAKRLCYLAALFERRGQYGKALVVAENATRTNPGELEAWTVLARLKSSIGDSAGAEIALRTSEKIKANHDKLRAASSATIRPQDGPPGFVRGLSKARTEKLAPLWIEAATEAGWDFVAEIWRIRRDYPYDKDAMPRLKQLASNPKFMQDVVFFPRPSLKRLENHPVNRIQRWIYWK